MVIPDLDFLPIPDPGVKTTPDPGSGTLQRTHQKVGVLHHPDLMSNVHFSTCQYRKLCIRGLYFETDIQARQAYAFLFYMCPPPPSPPRLLILRIVQI
jgi:hypothetical protein